MAPLNIAWLLYLKGIIALLTARNSNEVARARQLRCYPHTGNGGFEKVPPKVMSSGREKNQIGFTSVNILKVVIRSSRNRPLYVGYMEVGRTCQARLNLRT